MMARSFKTRASDAIKDEASRVRLLPHTETEIIPKARRMGARDRTCAGKSLWLLTRQDIGKVKYADMGRVAATARLPLMAFGGPCDRYGLFVHSKDRERAAIVMMCGDGEPLRSRLPVLRDLVRHSLMWSMLDSQVYPAGHCCVMHAPVCAHPLETACEHRWLVQDPWRADGLSVALTHAEAVMVLAAATEVIFQPIK